MSPRLQRAPLFQLAYRRRLHAASIALKRQGGEWRHTGCILGSFLFGVTYAADRVRRVRRERK